jgi:predicted ATP-dependent serine protease
MRSEAVRHARSRARERGEVEDDLERESPAPPSPATRTVYLCPRCAAERPTLPPFCWGCSYRGILDRVERPIGPPPLAREIDPEESEIDDEQELDEGEGGGARGPLRADVRSLPKMTSLSRVKLVKYRRVLTGIEGFDRVVGDEEQPGLREDLAIMLSGARGSGKSTLLLQACANVSAAGHAAAYGLGEGESPERLRATAARVGISPAALRGIHFLDLSDVPEGISKIDYFLELAHARDARLSIVDSVQGFCRRAHNLDELARVVKTAMRHSGKHRNPIVLVGHLNAEGQTAGGQNVQHMGDGVFRLQRFGEGRDRYVRFDCDGKNRGGWETEWCFFKLSRRGIEEYDPDDSELDAARTPRRGRTEETSRWRPANRRSARTERASPTAPSRPRAR